MKERLMKFTAFENWKQNAPLKMQSEGRIAEMTDFLNKQSAELEEYDEQLVRRLISTIYEDKPTVEFKSGLLTKRYKY